MKRFIRKDIRSIFLILSAAIFLFFLAGIFIVELSWPQKLGWILSMVSAFLTSLVFEFSLAEDKQKKNRYMNSSFFWKRILHAVVTVVIILIALFLIDYFLGSPNKWMRRSLFVIIAILVVGVQLKFGKR